MLNSKCLKDKAIKFWFERVFFRKFPPSPNKILLFIRKGQGVYVATFDKKCKRGFCMKEKEYYKEQIIKMVENIDSIWLLEQISRAIKSITKEG